MLDAFPSFWTDFAMTRAVSALGDTALLAPASVLLLLYLAAWRHWRLAFSFGAALAFTGMATFAAKLLFRACGPSFAIDVTSPSGHVSFATIFYGALALLLAVAAPQAKRAVVIAGAVVLLCAISVSRILVGAHSAPEVLLGGLIGLAGLGIFAALREPRPGPPLWPFIVAGGVAAAFVVLTGRHFNAEYTIARMADRLAGLDLCFDGPGQRAEAPILPARR